MSISKKTIPLGVNRGQIRAQLVFASPTRYRFAMFQQFFLLTLIVKCKTRYKYQCKMGFSAPGSETLLGAHVHEKSAKSKGSKVLQLYCFNAFAKLTRFSRCKTRCECQCKMVFSAPGSVTLSGAHMEEKLAKSKGSKELQLYCFNAFAK